MGNPEWAQLEMFQDMFVRAQNADVIYPFIEEWTMQHGKMEIMERCQAAGCPVTAVFTVAEAAEHPHLKARGYIVELEHPELGRFRDLGAPFKLPASPGGPRTAAPRLGEHSDDVFGEPRAPNGRPLRRRAAADDEAAAARAPTGATLPLAGVRVANFGWVWAGPVVGQTLALPRRRGVQGRVVRPRRHDAHPAALRRGRSAIPTAASRTTPAGPATAASAST